MPRCEHNWESICDLCKPSRTELIKPHGKKFQQEYLTEQEKIDRVKKETQAEWEERRGFAQFAPKNN